jgi:hypothetical protein
MVETKRKGRPSQTEKTSNPQSTSCTIKDEAMEPFYIIKDSSNFTVIEKSISTRGFGGKKATGKEQEKIIGYYSSFSNALNCIAKQKFYQNQGDYTSIKEYISTWNKVKNGLETLLKSIEI